MCRHVNVCHSILVGVRGQLAGVSFLIPSHVTGLVASTYTTVLSSHLWERFLISPFASIFQIYPEFEDFPCLSWQYSDPNHSPLLQGCLHSLSLNLLPHGSQSYWVGSQAIPFFSTTKHPKGFLAQSLSRKAREFLLTCKALCRG